MFELYDFTFSHFSEKTRWALESVAGWRVDAKLLQPHQQPRSVKWFAENAKQRVRRAGAGVTTFLIARRKNDRQHREVISAMAG